MGSSERKYEQDKVYLRAPNGVIWDHDPLLAAVPGYVSVVPNPSKAGKTEQPTQITEQTAQQNAGNNEAKK